MTISDNLSSGEKLLHETTTHPLYNLKHYIIGGAVSLTGVGAFVGVPYIIYHELKRRANKYAVTNKRVLHEYRLLSRRISTAPHGKIQDVHFAQGLMERLFGLGTININTAGSSGIEIQFRGVKDPLEVKKIIEKHCGS